MIRLLEGIFAHADVVELLSVLLRFAPDLLVVLLDAVVSLLALLVIAVGTDFLEGGACLKKDFVPPLDSSDGVDFFLAFSLLLLRAMVGALPISAVTKRGWMLLHLQMRRHHHYFAQLTLLHMEKLYAHV